VVVHVHGDDHIGGGGERRDDPDGEAGAARAGRPRQRPVSNTEAGAGGQLSGSAWARCVRAAGIEEDGSAGTSVHRHHEAVGVRMILAFIPVSPITHYVTNQTNRQNAGALGAQ
jgi:hypothetical protein